jgi:1-deoxy-D-xylulose-5-phosphate reductoisomerase
MMSSSSLTDTVSSTVALPSTFTLASQALLQQNTQTPIGLAILGSTGSIGTQSLQVVTGFAQHFKLIALAAGGSQLPLFASQLVQYQPLLACVPTQTDKQTLLHLLNGQYHGEILVGETDGLTVIAAHPLVDKVIIGMVGTQGVCPTLAALQAGKLVLTANKETFVSAGHLIQPYLAQIVPFDSEHSALFQCLCPDKNPQQVESLWLTASGGAFRSFSTEQLTTVTPQQALKHPNWQMGAKVTVDSATLMNKGLEVIEAHWLYGLPPERIKVVVHPQSMVHSLVEFIDGSFLASLAPTTMCIPIQYALSYPQYWQPIASVKRLNLLEIGELTFLPPDREKFPCLALAEACLQQGGWATATLNVADELAVSAFLAGNIGFTQIPTVIEKALLLAEAEGWHKTMLDLPTLLQLEAWIRNTTTEWLT